VRTTTDAWAQHWRELSEEVLTGMQDWRAAHPRATFAAIEAAVEEQLDRLRARLLEDAALASAAADVAALPDGARPRCPDCGQALAPRGQQKRTLTVRGDRAVQLERSYTVCPACGAGHFPPG
jgi:YgiT-type zinc finger domain-containing protein